MLFIIEILKFKSSLIKGIRIGNAKIEDSIGPEDVLLANKEIKLKGILREIEENKISKTNEQETRM